MENQIKTQMNKAFWDLVDEKIGKDLDVDWLVRLYAELSTRLTRWLRPGKSLHTEITNAYDVKFFEQKVKNGAFDQAELLVLINTTFDYVRQIQSPERDQDLDNSKNEILKYTQEKDATFGKTVVKFLKTIHIALDHVENDMQAIHRILHKSK
jgi:hypothetical protein